MLLRHAWLRYEFLVERAPGERQGGRARRNGERASALIRGQTKDTIIIFIVGGDGDGGRGRGGGPGGRGGMSMYGIFISGEILWP